MNQRILISGGGIAGMAAAWWLGRAGHEVTIVERARAFQPLGHFITLKGNGVRMVEAMGLLEACHARELPLRELSAKTAAGRLLRKVDPALLTSKVEGVLLFQRADLHAALYEAVRGHTSVRFGTEVQAIRQVGEQVEVDLPSGTERVDLLLGADGVHSRTRNLVFGSAGVSRLGGRYLAVTVDYAHGLTPGALSTYFGRGQFVVLLPRTAASISALIYHGDGGATPSGNDALSVREFLLRAYASFAPEVRRTFAALDETSFVFMDDIAMIELPSITRGRIALLGDAAHCPTFMSGMGASLALQGAHALSRALQLHPEAVTAIAAYEQAISEVARGYQRSAQRARPVFLGRNAQLAMVRDALLQWTPDWLIARSARSFYQTHGVTLSR